MIMDPTTNYTGAYLSDGTFQSSVAYGETKPTDYLDSESRLHDTAYAIYPDIEHRFAADELYAKNLRGEEGVRPKIAVQAVTKGNILMNGLNNLGTSVLKYGPVLGLVAATVNNIRTAAKLLNNGKAKADVANIRVNDPHPELQLSKQPKLNRVMTINPSAPSEPPMAPSVSREYVVKQVHGQDQGGTNPNSTDGGEVPGVFWNFKPKLVKRGSTYTNKYGIPGITKLLRKRKKGKGSRYAVNKVAIGV